MNKLRPNSTSTICVIGSGAAGLSAAYFLKELGYKSVIVLEKENRIGGKCLSITVEGKSFDLGANYITSSYKNVKKLAKKYGAKMYTEAHLNSYDYKENEFVPLLKAVLRESGTSFFKLGWLILKFVVIRFRLRNKISINKPGFKGISEDKELCKPFMNWLEDRGLKPLAPLFKIPISLMGYGQLSTISAAYALTYMTNSTFIDLVLASINPYIIGYPKRFTDGYQRLLERMSWEIDVRVGAEVVEVKRGDGIEVTFTQLEETLGNLKKSTQVLKSDYLFIATPTYLEAIKPFLKDITSEETRLLSKVIYDPFVVTTYKAPGLESFFAATFMVPETDDYQPFVITRQYKEVNLLSIYTRAEYGKVIDKEAILANNKEFIMKACGIDIGSYFTFSEFPYFPHVSSTDMQEGFYDDFDRIQGANNTFYVGGLMNFELVETIMNYSKHLVRQHFPKQK